MVTALTTAAEAQQRLRDGQGGIVFSYEQPNFGDRRPLANFTFAEFDPETGELVDRGETRTHTPQVRDWPLARARLDAGSYVLREIYLYGGGSAAYCFADRTIQFEVAEGEVIYLGHITFDAADRPADGFANRILGHNGDWRGALIRTAGDRDAAEARIGELFRNVDGFSDAQPVEARFPIEGRERRQIGRDCSNARPFQPENQSPS